MRVLKRDPCAVIDGKIRRKRDYHLVHENYLELVTGGYINSDLSVTEKGHDAAPQKLSRKATYNLMQKMRPGRKWFPMGRKFVATDDGRVSITRYAAELLVEEGKMEVDPMGYVVLKRQVIRLDVPIYADHADRIMAFIASLE